MSGSGQHSYVIVAAGLPCARASDGWRAAPGSLVSAVTGAGDGGTSAWVGWAGDETGADPDLLTDTTLIPVRFAGPDTDALWQECANRTIWPLYHDNVLTPQFRRSWWEAYAEVNRRCAEAVAEVCAPGAVVWVHDYQLQLVPAALAALRPDLRIGFFSHIPFPPVELFSQLPWREEILAGLLGAEVLGFQRESDVRNFDDACRRLRGAGPAESGTAVGAHPVSVDAGLITDIVKRPEIRAKAARIRADVGEPETLLFGIDRLDHAKGILERLHAVEELLDKGTLDPRTTRMVQVAVPARETHDDYCELRDEIEHTVGRINGNFADLAGTTIHYHYRDFAFESVFAWYLAADVLIASSLRDGMNLVAKEYVAARRGRGGVLVLSEFTGAADELTDALIVNPHDRESLKSAIAEAVAMDPAEAARRMDRMAATVADRDARAWAAGFVGALGSGAFGSGALGSGDGSRGEDAFETARG